MRLLGAAVVFSTGLWAACAPPGARDGGAEAARGAASDTLRGVVVVVGVEPGSRVEIRPGDASAQLPLVGPVSEEARLLQGVEVWVSGRLEDGEFRGEELSVRAVEGKAAVEGLLGRDGDGWFLEVEDGVRIPLRNVPAGLQAREGERVWISAPLDVGGGSFGPRDAAGEGKTQAAGASHSGSPGGRGER